MTLKLDSIRKSFGSKQVLSGLSLAVAPGEVYGLVGPNGAGKTTAINILCGLLEADGGEATIAGEPSMQNRHRIAVVPQEMSVYGRLTCRQNLRLFADLYGLGREESKNRIDEVIRQMQLVDHADLRVETLSGGWARRVNIAASIIHRPAALVLDEPTAGLDIEARHELWRLIECLCANEVAILITTHQLDEAELLCSRVGILSEGRIAAEGTMDALRRRIPAVVLAVAETADEGALREKAQSLGWDLRNWGGHHTLCLPRRYDLKELAEMFDGCPLVSLAVREIGLEHVYLEVTGALSA